MAEGTCLQSFEINFMEEAICVDSNCPICLELLRKPFLTECCRHHFCNKCINSAKQRKNECPLCKASPVKGAIDKQFSKELNETTVYCSLRDKGCQWTGQLCNLKNHLSLGQQNGQCKHVRVSCPNSCKIMLTRNDLKKHVNLECGQRFFTCPFCSHTGIYTDIVTNHYPKCVNFPVTCPNKCVNTEMKQSELPKHLVICPNVMVPCLYSDIGCKVTMKRCNVKKHVESNVGINQHQTLFFKALTELENNNKVWNKELGLKYQDLSSHLESQVASLKDKYDQIEHDLFSLLHLHEESEVKKEGLIAELYEANKKLVSSLSTLQTKQAQLEDDLHITRKENEAMRATIKSLQSRCGNLESQFGKLKSQLFSSSRQMIENKMKHLYDNTLVEVRQLLQTQTMKNTSESLSASTSDAQSEGEVATLSQENTWLVNSLTALQSKCSVLESRFDKLQDQFTTCKKDIIATKVCVDSELRDLKTKVTKFQTNTTVSSDQHQNVEFWICGYKLMANKMKEKNWKLYLKTMSEASTQFPDALSPVIIHVSGYDKAKIDRTILVTSPFYTAGAGRYKFELHICIAPCIGTGNSYMSICASLLKGEYDDLLTWPFVGRISVTLLNQIENNDHFTKHIWLSHDPPGLEYAGRVAGGQYRNCSWGQNYFISHWELENVTALKQYVVNDCIYFRVDASATQHPANAKNCILH